MNAVERCLKSLDQGFSEELSHTPLLRAVKDLSPEQAAWKPSLNRKSIWQNVLHIAFWTTYYARRLGGEPRRPAEWYQDIQWEEVSNVTPEAWGEAVKKVVDAQEAFRAQVARLREDQLDTLVPGSEASIYDFIQTVITHNSYHCGHIMYVRALHGLPPLV